jgi:hypothetical protein
MIDSGKYLVFPGEKVRIWQNGDSFLTVRQEYMEEPIRAGYYRMRGGQLWVSMGSYKLQIRSVPELDLPIVRKELEKLGLLEPQDQTVF